MTTVTVMARSRLKSSTQAALGLSVLCSPAAFAHSFGQPYTMPVPFRLYAYGAAMTLVLSFFLIALLKAKPDLGRVVVDRAVPTSFKNRSTAVGDFGSALSFGLLLLCIFSGLFGTQNPFRNFNMTFFWIVFVLVVPYTVALFGDYFSQINPWHTFTKYAQRLFGISFAGKIRYDSGFGYYPAVAFYVVFIWPELFGALTPRGLAVGLLLYSVLNVAGAWLIGAEKWFKYCEFFGVMMRLLGRLSLLNFSKKRMESCCRVADPHFSIVIFAVFMLSSTAYDGLHATLPFAQLYWADVFPKIGGIFAGFDISVQHLKISFYHFWQWAMMLVVLVIYLVVFSFFAWLAKVIVGSPKQTKTIIIQFSLTILPIAFAYHVAHYFTLIFSQGTEIFRISSDPLGFGWDILGTATVSTAPLMIDMGTVWHIQVALILAGHVLSVYHGHIEALQLSRTKRLAVLSQMPMLLLMVAFTVSGLWILSLPIA